MNTTAVFVEQVLIGLLLIFCVLLPFSENLLEDLLGLDLGGAAAIVALAYLTGIVYDRCADTLLQDLERHHRIWYAIRLQERGSREKHLGDPFPEDDYRARILKESGKIQEYADYLRSRIRLARAVTTLAPAAGVVLLASGLDSTAPSPVRQGLLWTTIIVYALALVSKIRHFKLLKEPDIPRTDKLVVPAEKERYVSMLGYSTETRGPREGMLRFLLRHERLSLGALFLTVVGIVVALAYSAHLVIMPLGGLLLMLISGWTWWRITETFFDLLAAYGRSGGTQQPETTV